MGIDDIADKKTRNLQDEGELFEETFLAKRARTQWPAYLDQTAVEVADGIGQGDTGIDKTNFGSELGPRYRDGMEAATGEGADLRTIVGETISERDLGTIVYQLNRLSYEIEREDSGLENVQEAIEAVFEKLLTSETGYDLSTRGRSGTGTIADVIVEMFSDERIARKAKMLVDEFESSLGEGLLAKLDEPQMMTPLWEHQSATLQAWQDAGYRGYADMATATGKTVLGIAAIALRYGHLHPVDDMSGAKETDRRDHVLVVAHNDLIIEQWRREFDRHLNIPRERTGTADDIELSWGHVHFRTPQSLLNQEVYNYDLVILDEAHHYATGNEWGDLLDEFDGDILALSGSVDDAGTDSEELQRRLRQKVGPELVRYTIGDAQADGVIPAFDWEVRYAPYVDDEQFTAVTENIEELYPEFTAAVEEGKIDTDRPLRTYDEIRTFAHTTEGKEYKRENDAFQDLSTALFSRRTRRWNLSPELTSVVDIVGEHPTDHVVVLADSNAQVKEIAGMISDRFPDIETFVVTRNQERSDLRDTIDDFDASETGGVLVGTGDLLGEGVDIPNARVAINMATGGVNPELVQRIGRVLRNPLGDKHAQFYNVVGVPVGDAAVPREDGRRLLSDASQFCVLGDKFENLPAFATSAQLDDATLGALLQKGDRALEELASDGDPHDVFDLSDPRQREFLSELRARISDTEPCLGDEVLARWGEYSWLQTAGVDHSSTDEEGESAVDEPDDTPEESEPEADVEEVNDASEAVKLDADDDDREETDRVATRVELTQSLRRLDNATDGIPTRETVESEGEFDPSVYEEVFGSWEIALRAADIAIESTDKMDDERERVVEWLQKVAVEVERAPTPSDLYAHDEASPTDVYNAFGSWADALEAAEVTNGPSEDLVESFRESTGSDGDGADTITLPNPNELAELYEAFSQLHELLEALVESDVTVEEPGDGSPIAVWEATIRRWLSGDGPTGAPSYGRQQSERNPVQMPEYREAYGDGNRVIEFSVIETATPTQMERSLLTEAGLLADDQPILLPVAPQSGIRLPIAVIDERDLGQALLLLSEFPTYPYPASSEIVELVERGGGPVERLVADLRGVDESGPDVELRLDIGDLQGVEMIVEPNHDIDATWEEGERYELQRVRAESWESEGRTRYRLRSTEDTQISLIPTPNSDRQLGGDEHLESGLIGQLKRALGDEDSSDPDGAGTDVTSKQELVEALQSLSDDLGRAPLRPDVQEHSDYSYQTYVSEFGSFDDALETADIDLHASLLDEIERVAEKLGREPTSGDLDDHAAYSSGTYSTRFDSWADAVERADLPSFDDSQDDPPGDEREEMISTIQSLHESLDRVPKTTDVSDSSDYGQHDFVSEFGSWDKALEAAEIDREQELLDEIRRVADEIGDVPTTGDMNQYGDYWGSTYSSHFGSWGEAVEQADLSDIHSGGERQSELIETLQSLDESLNRIPKVADLADFEDVSLDEYVDEFGSFDAALEAAGIDKKQALLDDLRTVAEDLGHAPGTIEMTRHGVYSADMYASYFGSYSAALAEADLADVLPDNESDLTESGSNVSRTRLIEILQSQYEELGRSPMTPDLWKLDEVTKEDYMTEFGSWHQALSAADVGEGRELRDELQSIAKKLGRVPTKEDATHYGEYSADQYIAHFGSWVAAVEAVDLTNHNTDVSGGDDESEDTGSWRLSLLQELERLDRELDGLLKATDMQEEGEFSIRDYTEEFGSWDEALDEAGIDIQERLLSEIERVWEQLGHRPLKAEMDLHGRVSTGMIGKYFDSWSAACDRVASEMAETDPGTETPTDVLSEEESATTTEPGSEDISRSRLVEILQSRYDKLNRSPKTSDIWKLDGVTEEDYVAEFGSWQEALVAADVGEGRDLRDELESLAEDLGRVPRKSDLNQHGDYTADRFTAHFGSWEAAIEAADLSDDGSDVSDEPEDPEQRRDQLLSELKQLDRELDRLPKATDIEQETEFSVHQYTEEFGSWDEALADAGIDKGEELLSEIKRVWEQVGHRPSRGEMDEHGRVSSTMVGQHFDSWSAACDRVGSEVEEAVSNTDTTADVLSEITEVTLFESVDEGDQVDAYLAWIAGTMLWVKEPKEAELRTKDLAGKPAWVDIFAEEGNGEKFETGNWYLLRGIEAYREDTKQIRLRSTPAFTATKLGSDTDRETLRAVVRDRGLIAADVSKEWPEGPPSEEDSGATESNASAGEPATEDDDESADGGEDVVDRLMDDLGL